MRLSEDKAKKVTLFQHFIINEFSMRPRFRFSYVSVFCIALLVATGCGQDGREDAQYYFALDDHMVSSNRLMQRYTAWQLIEMTNYADGNHYYAQILPIAEKAVQITSNFEEYIGYLRAGLVTASGGLYPVDYADQSLAGRPVKYDNREISYAYFSKGDKSKGEELFKELAETKSKLNLLIDSLIYISKEIAYVNQEEIDQLKTDLALNDEQFILSDNGKDRDQVFRTSVAKVFPMLSMLQNKVIRSEAAILNFLHGKLSGQDLYWGGSPIPVSIPEKSFVYLGEKFSTEICFFFEGYYPPYLEKISVDGISLPIIQGRAHYETIARRKGENAYEVEIWVKDFADKKPKKYSKIFKYEVGTRCD